MGLSIYFCDICGVRITDADLRSGHGMLQGYDAICAGCIDLGHGKPWLESRQATVPVGDAFVTPRGSLDTKDTVRMRTESSGDFGQAAVALGAMAAPIANQPAAIDLDDPTEARGPGEQIAGSALQKTDKTDQADSEPAAKNPGKPGKDKSASVRISGNRTSGKTPSSSDIKAKTGRLSGREASAEKQKKTQFMVTVIGVSIIITCGLYVLYTRYAAANHRPSGKVVNMNEDETSFREQMDATRKQADEAYQSKDPTKIKAARDAITQLKQQLKAFNDTAIKAGWTDHDVEVWVSQLHLEETWNKDRLLRDAMLVNQ